jgi:hypothetical protein
MMNMNPRLSVPCFFGFLFSIIPQVRGNQEIDFAHAVVPILKKHCIQCHSGASKKGGLSINSREEFLRGGEGGAAFEVGKSADSAMIDRIRSKDSDYKMPPEGDRLSPIEIATLEKWIDSGAKWEDGFVFQRPAYEPPLRPRRPTLPAARPGRDHPIDRILDQYLMSHNVEASEPVSDEHFLRRIYLDLVGMLPTPEQRAKFLADARPDKRLQLIRSLLNDDVAYAEHWLSFWNDLLRNDYGGTGFITNGRTQISRWLYEALITNKPYDQFVRELIAPDKESAGFSNGIRWRGTVSAGQTVEIQFAQSVGQSFLGINLKCASCHDSFIDRWKLEDAYGLAAIYANDSLDIHRCDKPIGKKATPGWMFPELGQVDPTAPQAKRLTQLAALMTHPENGRWTRTIVNRLWHRLMGRGIVHPVDAMQGPPWSDDLLDFLAVDFADHNYNLKHTMELICSSQAYQSKTQLSANAEPETDYVYRGPRSKRMTAEQFVDAVWQITGNAPGRYDAPVLRGKASAAANNDVSVMGQWIWASQDPSGGLPKAGETISLRKSIDLNAAPLRAGAIATCDNSFTLYVNGAQIQSSDNWEQPLAINLSGRLKKGKNEFLVVAKNAGSDPNPAGFFLDARLVYEDGRIETVASNADWEWTTSVPNKNGKFKSDPEDWKPAQLANNPAVWNRAMGSAKGILAMIISKDQPMVRSSLLKSDLLQRTLGRPNRDQIVSTRPNELSTLEAIDLSNSQALFNLLESGAGQIRNAHGADRDRVLAWLTRFALSRDPTPEERKLAAESWNSSLSQEEIQDLMWAILMTPEFQLVQ